MSTGKITHFVRILLDAWLEYTQTKCVYLLNKYMYIHIYIYTMYVMQCNAMYVYIYIIHI